ncbi:protein kinase domain-containing protein [Nocardia sp.]|uniref:protein kinase domain-containing protein n=1 Tax=Nocardia sp. TaxID=1821 RepID=UPI0039C9C153
MVEELQAAGFTGAVEIGHGGFGVVYRCLQTALDRVVAVKVLSPDMDAESRERFLREEQAMGRVSGHPHIVDILQVDVTAAGLPFIVMPFCAHGSLERLVVEQGPLSWADTLRVGVKLAGAIESAHRARILHRDVKPGNVLLSAYGEPQLTDFGIARIPGGFRTSSSLITGSPAFTAPEVLKGQEPTVRSDVYGLGATLFALLTGHAAFERQAGERVVAQFLRITTQPVPDLREQQIPPPVAEAIEAAMAQDVERRPESAFEFGEMLRAAQRALGQVPDEMALLDPLPPGVLPHGEPVPDDAGERQAGTQGRPAPLVAARRSWPLTLRPDVSRHPAAPDAAPAETMAVGAGWTTTGPSAPPPAAATKFRPATPAKEPLARPRLLEVLRAGGRRRLALIHAPAGFGKSTVAAQWRAELAARGTPVAWISLDRYDDNEVWFLAHLLQAIHRVRPEIGIGLEQVLEEELDDAVPYVVSTLIDEVHSRGETIVVVVENWHRITDPGALRAMDTLLGNGCHHLRFVVTSRDQSGLPLNAMRVDDELVEIGSAQLRLTPAETARILVERNGFDLTDQQVEQIHRSTDGWPAAVQLISLALRGNNDPRRLLASGPDSGHNIREYLAENVLDTLEPRMLDFLTAVAVTERVNADLAAALSGATDADELLAQAEQRELFLRRIDHDPGWYRMQPLFAEHLRARLERTDQSALRALHRKASRWYAEHQFLRKSVDHALAATDLKMALDLVEGGGMDLIDGSRLATLLGTVSKLPLQQVTSRSKLLMAVARANVNLQQSEAARSALGRLTTMLPGGNADEGEARAQRREAAVIAAADAVTRDRTEGVLDQIADVLDDPGDLPTWTVSTAANVAAYARLCEFDYAGAIELQDWAAPYHEKSKYQLGPVFGLLARGVAAYEQLDVAAASAAFEQAWETAHRRSGPRSHGVRVVAAMLGELKYRAGDLAGADRMLDESHQLVARVGTVDVSLATFVTGARVKALIGDMRAATARLDEGERIAADAGLPRLAAAVRAERLRLGLPVTPPTADLLVGERGVRRARGAEALVAEAEEIAVVRAMLAGMPPHSEDAAVRHARALHGRAVEQGRPRAELDTALLLAECLAAAGWVGEATSLLVPAAETCAGIGWSRPLLDAGPRVVAILRVLRSEADVHATAPGEPVRTAPAVEVAAAPNRSARGGRAPAGGAPPSAGAPGATDPAAEVRAAGGTVVDGPGEGPGAGDPAVGGPGEGEVPPPLPREFLDDVLG